MLIEFAGNDGKYLAWLSANPTGFVLNTRSQNDPFYMVLHRSNCWTISSAMGWHTSPGRFTEHAYKKICSDTIEELRGWVRLHDRQDGSFSNSCARCGPR